jgi:hypothetical protein
MKYKSEIGINLVGLVFQLAFFIWGVQQYDNISELLPVRFIMLIV